jgi:Zn-dependent protease with chaperone function
MDFFEAQDRAKNNTGKLVVLYLIAVILIIITVNLAAALLLGNAGIGQFIVVTIIILTTIALGTLYRVSQLRRGGSAVAEMLGGRKVEPSTRNSKERQLVNIVEEMSIASGIPVPDIYILDKEDNINAFAAGYGTADAAVGITLGALEKLNRDEIQGVIAHEFSHIFNGDMRLNIRLIGVLNGILVLHIAGMILMRSTMYSGAIRRSGGGRGSQGGGNATIAIMLFGLALIVIGYIGMVFGRMIQAAISRQREYLADAAAVQYTRNPDGLAGALRKIAQTKDGAKIKDGHAMELSHLFFARSFHSALDLLFATHPPLDKRIKAIDPAFDEENEKMKQKINRRLEKDRIARSKVSASSGTQGGGLPGRELIPGLSPELLLAAIGTIEGEQLHRAGKLIEEIPSALRQAAHEPLDAEALIYGLLIIGQQKDPRIPGWLQKELNENLTDRLEKLLIELSEFHRNWLLPLAELSLPTLRNMNRQQYHEFRKIIEKLAHDDQQISIFEFALEKMITRQLDTHFSDRKQPEIRHHHLKPLAKETAVLLSALAYASESDPNSAFDAGLKSIEKVCPEGVSLLPEDACNLDALDNALDEFASSANPVKRYIITAAVHTVASDKSISSDEAELLRAVGEALDTPIPVIADQS